VSEYKLPRPISLEDIHEAYQCGVRTGILQRKHHKDVPGPLVLRKESELYVKYWLKRDMKPIEFGEKS